jgi:hypothetical protein
MFPVHFAIRHPPSLVSTTPKENIQEMETAIGVEEGTMGYIWLIRHRRVEPKIGKQVESRRQDEVHTQQKSQ